MKPTRHKPLNMMLIRPGDGPVGVNLPDDVMFITTAMIRAVLGENCQNIERCDALFGGEHMDLYCDADAAKAGLPINLHASRMRTAMIRKRNPRAKDKAQVRGFAVLVQGPVV